ncbi:MAG: FAD-dependent oxidoreductase, partial [Acidimicrobiia bacterium]|nr:FAD-dependent oxidoreductase [Acidimicrobiia bacterium]
PEAGRCRSDAAVAALQRRVGELGGDVRHECPVEAILPLAHGGVEVTAGGEVWRAGSVVVAAGAWAAGLIGDLAVLPPLEVTQEVVAHFRPLEGDGDAWPRFIHHRDPWTYGLGAPGEGVKVARHHVGLPVDPDRRPPIDPSAVECLSRHVERWFPGLDPEPAGATTCLYTSTPSQDFVVDRVGPVVIGSPCSGHGFKFTPEIGRLLADLAEGSPPEIERFTLAAVRTAAASARATGSGRNSEHR